MLYPVERIRRKLPVVANILTYKTSLIYYSV